MLFEQLNTCESDPQRGMLPATSRTPHPAPGTRTSARVAERTTTHGYAAGSSTGTGGGARFVLHSDHLGSVSLATNSSGVTVTNSLARFFPFGTERGAAPSGTPTDFSYATGRGTPSLGLIHLGARWYDSYLRRWSSPDNIIPDAANPQDYNRYSYVLNSPLRYTDPSGHMVCDDAASCGPDGGVTNGSLGILYWGQTMDEAWNERVLQYLKDHPGYTFEGDYLLPVEGQVFFMSLKMEAERQRTGEWPTAAALFEGMGAIALYNADVDSLNFSGGGGPGGTTVSELRRLVNEQAGSGAVTTYAFVVPDHMGGGGGRPPNGAVMHVDDALDAAQDFLGEGYVDMGRGRFVSADGLRQVRMGDGDLLGHYPGDRPHLNFENLAPRPGRPGRYDIIENRHIYFWEP